MEEIKFRARFAGLLLALCAGAWCAGWLAGFLHGPAFGWALVLGAPATALAGVWIAARALRRHHG
jgi:hypothetical protein